MADHVGERTVRRSPSARRLLATVPLLLLGACSSSSGSSEACGFPAPTSAVALHLTVSRNAQWPQQLAAAVEEMPSDSTVRVLFVHASAVTQADRDHLTTSGATIENVPEAADWNGIVASIAVSDLRELAPEANTNRIWDVHLLRGEVILPPCD